MHAALQGTAFAAGAAAFAAGAWAYAARSPQSQIFGRTLIAGHDPSEAALTFDDGPNGDTTLRLLDVLAEHEARATFFVLGGFVRQQPEIVRAIAAAGHLVGNHTMTHPWLDVQNRQRIREELSGCSAVIEDTLGQPVRFFRAPHGARRPYVLQYARELGMTPVQWNIIVGDWVQERADVLACRVARGVARNRSRKRGTNIVLHDGGQESLGQPRMPTIEAVGRILQHFNGEGIRTVTVDAWTEPVV